MPTINIYSENNYFDEDIIESLKNIFIELLSCNDIKLNENEFSFRILKTDRKFMIADIELEIKAHHFKERVEEQDIICNKVREFLLEKIPEVQDIRVWLILSELWHSW